MLASASCNPVVAVSITECHFFISAALLTYLVCQDTHWEQLECIGLPGPHVGRGFSILLWHILLLHEEGQEKYNMTDGLTSVLRKVGNKVISL